MAKPRKLERVTGIEPVSQAWKAGALPLSYTRAEVNLARPARPEKPRLSLLCLIFESRVIR